MKFRKDVGISRDYLISQLKRNQKLYQDFKIDRNTFEIREQVLKNQIHDLDYQYQKYKYYRNQLFRRYGLFPGIILLGLLLWASFFSTNFILFYISMLAGFMVATYYLVWVYNTQTDEFREARDELKEILDAMDSMKFMKHGK